MIPENAVANEPRLFVGQVSLLPSLAGSPDESIPFTHSISSVDLDLHPCGCFAGLQLRNVCSLEPVSDPSTTQQPLRTKFAPQIPAEYSEENLWPLFSPFGAPSNCDPYSAPQGVATECFRIFLRFVSQTTPHRSWLEQTPGGMYQV